MGRVNIPFEGAAGLCLEAASELSLRRERLAKRVTGESSRKTRFEVVCLSALLVQARLSIDCVSSLFTPRRFPSDNARTPD
jgi:hypothetical protein